MDDTLRNSLFINPVDVVARDIQLIASLTNVSNIAPSQTLSVRTHTVCASTHQRPKLN